jgi:hypothetical protein
VRDEQVGVAVEIVVAKSRRDVVGPCQVVDARPGRDVGEAEVSTCPVIAVYERGIVEQAADEQVEIAVAVDVCKRGTAMPVAFRGRGRLGNAGD